MTALASTTRAERATGPAGPLPGEATFPWTSRWTSTMHDGQGDPGIGELTACSSPRRRSSRFRRGREGRSWARDGVGRGRWRGALLERRARTRRLERSRATLPLRQRYRRVDRYAVRDRRSSRCPLQPPWQKESPSLPTDGQRATPFGTTPRSAPWRIGHREAEFGPRLIAITGETKTTEQRNEPEGGRGRKGVTTNDGERPEGEIQDLKGESRQECAEDLTHNQTQTIRILLYSLKPRGRRRLSIADRVDWLSEDNFDTHPADCRLRPSGPCGFHTAVVHELRRATAAMATEFESTENGSGPVARCTPQEHEPASQLSGPQSVLFRRSREQGEVADPASPFPRRSGSSG